ncbi:putative fatty acyl-CoA reductase [Lucilia cuprina]|uniref:Fatty acyl-CoA reductase n=1 Tax=Lucilia cuprina TaxID=7375 RepID=A0A0L0BTQ4_LUCCU|nr:fatty acyl-CoA reductase 1 [Lucilia cuprina]XP_046809923.1 fatty acyl-CoA reductase 1 [Lucilia cuprina]KAI8117470.1 putative fatty acyl-CoA reductase [Lucilia cuprina]KNC23465.1 putative fatty acyl-CoA reductase [Lucilia cuprina]
MPAKPKFEFEKDPLVHIDGVDENEEDRIAKSFEGRCLFITGGTGFLGKVLVEKLLRSCGDLKKIYLLIRPKKGKEPVERIKEMFDNVLFDMVKKQRGEDVILSKVQAIYGDVLQPGLGISEEDVAILSRDVSIVYHCAATVRFDEPLRQAVFMNTRGTKYMLELAAKLKNLSFFAYVSTAYCHLHVKTLYEKPYDPPADPHKVMNACEWLSDEEVGMIEKKILGDIPNTYAYTKSLAEALVVEKFDELPAVILRPSIVIPIWREPIPGWTDNINGPTGLLIGAGKGVIRTMYCNSSGFGDFLPVDVAVNGILVASWRFLTRGAEETNRVAHMTSSNDIKVSWAEIIELGRWVIENRVPLNGVAWYPGGSMKSNYFVHWICMILFHWLPAIFADILLRIFGYPPVLMRVQDRISKGFEVFEYYANNVWNFDNTEAVKMRKLMNKKERLTYVIEKIDVDLIEYFTNCVLCARRLILKESDESIPAAKRHMKVMWCVDKIFKGMWIFGIAYMIYKCFLSDYLTSTTVTQPIGSF